MKHLSDDSLHQTILMLEQLGVDIEQRAMLDVLRHLDYVIDRNRDLNLTRVDEPADALRLHVVDSLVALPELDRAPEGRLLDLGTGGGFPGMPLALVSKRPTVLLDSVRKKGEAIQRYLLQENLESWISVSTERIETYAHSHRGEFAVVTARAVAELPVLIELAAPLLKQLGCLIALKARPSEEELARAVKVAHLCGMRLDSDREIQLPGGDERRRLIVFSVRETPAVSLPRAVGRAQKRPLA